MRRIARFYLAIAVVTLFSGLSFASVVSPAAVRASSFPIVDNPPCNPTGSYDLASLSKTMGFNVHYGQNQYDQQVTLTEQAVPNECRYGSYVYIKPRCRAQSGWLTLSHNPDAYFNECYVFLWTPSVVYAQRYGFTKWDVNQHAVGHVHRLVGPRWHTPVASRVRVLAERGGLCDRRVVLRPRAPGSVAVRVRSVAVRSSSDRLGHSRAPDAQQA
jgi:hypothetical protein